MLDSKPTTTLRLLGQTLSHLDNEPLSDATLYRSTIGALQYLTLTRPDTSFVVNKACQALYPMTFTCSNPPRWIFMDILMSVGHFEICLSSSSLPLFWCDNKSATHLATNLVFHPRTKHIELDLHFIWDQVLHKQLIIQYIPSSEQVANIFTKHITSSQSLSFKTKLFVVPSPMNL
ncbi:hypothetical protein AAG906_033308 [Vitis piasezkii]